MSVFLAYSFVYGDQDELCRHLGGVKWGDVQCNLHGLVKVLVGDGLVAQSLELVCGSHGEDGS